MIALEPTIVRPAVAWLGAQLAGIVAHRSPATAMVTTRRVGRRMLIRNAVLGAVGIVLAQIGVGVGALLWPNKTGAFGAEITVSAADVPPVMGTPYRNTAGHFYLARNEHGLLALWWKCPHLGCTVPWVGPPDSPQAFQCPCHGSMYDYNGVLTAGPAPRPMDLMTVTVAEDGNVRVDTGTITTRREYTPDQAATYQG